MKGHSSPRIAPPLPSVSAGWRDLKAVSSTIGMPLLPWQAKAARYLGAENGSGGWLYREVAVIVARQNGKTTLLVPLIIQRLLQGQRMIHSAQNRELPREVFGLVADLLVEHFKPQLRLIRFGSGQESIRMKNGGHYRIVAPTRGGARGPSTDLVIVDELREMIDQDFIAAAKPTLIASPKPQMVYLSNAGTDGSVVLNALRSRKDTDPSLAYLEWSAAPGREADDREGWREANPAIGYLPGVLRNLEAEHRANQLGNTMAIFETEHLCRWRRDLRQTVFRPAVWEAVRASEPLAKVPPPYALGIGVTPGWTRASVAVAARRSDGRIGVEIYRDLRDNVTPQKVTAAIEDFQRKRQAATIAYDQLSGGAGEFERHAAEQGLPYDPLKGGAVTAAVMDVCELIMARRLAVDDPLLDYQIPLVVKRTTSPDGAFRFSRTQSPGPIDAVEAMVYAAHAISYAERTPNIY